MKSLVIMVSSLAIVALCLSGLEYAYADNQKEWDFPSVSCPSYGMDNIKIIARPSGVVTFDVHVEGTKDITVTPHIDQVYIRGTGNQPLFESGGFDLPAVSAGHPFLGTAYTGVYSADHADLFYPQLDHANFEYRCN